MKDFFNKETLDNIKQFCAENKKYVGVAGVLVGLILILIVDVSYMQLSFYIIIALGSSHERTFKM